MKTRARGRLNGRNPPQATAAPRASQFNAGSAPVKMPCQASSTNAVTPESPAMPSMPSMKLKKLAVPTRNTAKKATVTSDGAAQAEKSIPRSRIPASTKAAASRAPGPTSNRSAANPSSETPSTGAQTPSGTPTTAAQKPMPAAMPMPPPLGVTCR